MQFDVDEIAGGAAMSLGTGAGRSHRQGNAATDDGGHGIAQLPSVEAVVNYFRPSDVKPRTYTYHPPPPGEPMSTVVPDPRTVTIHDARPVVSQMSLDREGFSLIRFEPAGTDFDDDAAVRGSYYREAERALKAETGADRVAIFDHTIRRHIPGSHDDRIGPRQPVPRIHVDQTVVSGPQRVHQVAPQEADELLRGRVQIINLWRPIRGPVQDFPLAICDASSVRFDDLVAADHIYRDRVGETYQVVYNSAHRWFYVPEMRTDEALLLKCFDSRTDGAARFAPHTAFVDPTTPAGAPPRLSIEVRALVFHRA
jgi:hypothetical protein